MNSKIDSRLEELLEIQNGMQRSISAATPLNTYGRSVMFDEENFLDTQSILHNYNIYGQHSGEIMFEKSSEIQNPVTVLDPKLRRHEVWSPRINAGLSDLDRKEFFLGREHYSQVRNFSDGDISHETKYTKNKNEYESSIKSVLSLKSKIDLGESTELEEKLKTAERYSFNDKLYRRGMKKSLKIEHLSNTTVSLNSFSSSSETNETNNDNSSDSDEGVRNCVFKPLVKLGLDPFRLHKTNEFHQSVNIIKPGEEPEGFVNPDPNFKGKMMIFTYVKDSDKYEDQKKVKNQVKEYKTEISKEEFKTEEYVNDRDEQLKFQVSNAEIKYKETVEQAKRSKRLFIESLEANFRNENTNETVQFLKQKEYYVTSLLEMNEAKSTYMDLIKQNGLSNIELENYIFERASVIESRYKFEPLKEQKKDVEHKVSKHNLKVSESKSKKRKTTKKKVSNNVNKSVELLPSGTCDVMKILKTVDGTMDRIFEKLPFEEFNKLQVYFDKTEPRYPFGHRKHYQKHMKTVEKKDDSATRIEQWKQEENSTKKKNPLNCCSLFEKYCNRINNCRPKKNNHGPAKLNEMVKKLKILLNEQYKKSHSNTKPNTSNSVKEDINLIECNRTVNKVRKFRKKEKSYDSDPEHEYLDGQRDFRQLFKMNAFRSMAPILTNLQLGKNKELVSPVELLQAVKDCKIKGEELTFGLATEITNEWNESRIISVDEALFAIHNPSEYISLCESSNPMKRDYEIYEWTVNKKTYKKKLRPYVEQNIIVGTLDGRVPGTMEKEFKKTLKNFKHDPKMDKFIESPFNPFNEASEMTALCFDIHKFSKLLALPVEPVKMKLTGNNLFYNRVEKTFNIQKKEIQRKLKPDEKLPEPSSAAKNIMHSISDFSFPNTIKNVYKTNKRKKIIEKEKCLNSQEIRTTTKTNQTKMLNENCSKMGFEHILMDCNKSQIQINNKMNLLFTKQRANVLTDRYASKSDVFQKQCILNNNKTAEETYNNVKKTPYESLLKNKECIQKLKKIEKHFWQNFKLKNSMKNSKLSKQADKHQTIKHNTVLNKEKRRIDQKLPQIPISHN